MNFNDLKNGEHVIVDVGYDIYCSVIWAENFGENGDILVLKSYTPYSTILVLRHAGGYCWEAPTEISVYEVRRCVDETEN